MAYALDLPDWWFERLEELFGHYPDLSEAVGEWLKNIAHEASAGSIRTLVDAAETLTDVLNIPEEELGDLHEQWRDAGFKEKIRVLLTVLRGKPPWKLYHGQMDFLVFNSSLRVSLKVVINHVDRCVRPIHLESSAA